MTKSFEKRLISNFDINLFFNSKKWVIERYYKGDTSHIKIDPSEVNEVLLMMYDNCWVISGGGMIVKIVNGSVITGNAKIYLDSYRDIQRYAGMHMLAKKIWKNDGNMRWYEYQDQVYKIVSVYDNRS